jgi:hypothetical protein
VNLKAITTRIPKLARPALHIQKNSPTLLFGAGVIGVAASVVLACRATLKVDELLENHEKTIAKIEAAKSVDAETYTEKDYQRDTALAYIKTGVNVAKLYAPAIVIGLAAVGALTGAHVVLSRRNVALTAAYAALDRGFRDYRDRVMNKYGKDVDEEFRHGYEWDEIDKIDDKGVVTKAKAKRWTNLSQYARIFDESNPNWSRDPGYNQLFIQCQQNYMNDRLRANGHVFLNEVYDALGMPRSPEGQIVGWVMRKDGQPRDHFIDFGVFKGDVFSATRFVNGDERSVVLDFNVDGPVYNLI